MKIGREVNVLLHGRFYLNVVGYEVVHKQISPVAATGFYLNVVGYEV